MASTSVPAERQQAPPERGAVDDAARAAALLRLAEAREWTADWRSRLERLVAAGDSEKARRKQELLFKSFRAQLAALDEANRRRKVRFRLPPEELVRLARRVRPYQQCTEPVFPQLQAKPRGGYRRTLRFGIIHQAKQLLVKRAIMPFVKPVPWQYGVKGRGRDTACKAVHASPQNGYKWVVLFDIKDCFGSFWPDRVAELMPLPRRVTANVIVAINLNVRPGECMGADDDLGRSQAYRRGIPHGSLVSSLVAEALLSDLLNDLPMEARRLLYMDNGLILTRTKREALEIKETLLAAARRHRAGLLELRDVQVRQASHGFDFPGTASGPTTASPRPSRSQSALPGPPSASRASSRKGARGSSCTLG